MGAKKKIPVYWHACYNRYPQPWMCFGLLLHSINLNLMENWWRAGHCPKCWGYSNEELRQVSYSHEGATLKTGREMNKKSFWKLPIKSYEETKTGMCARTCLGGCLNSLVRDKLSEQVMFKLRFEWQKSTMRHWGKKGMRRAMKWCQVLGQEAVWRVGGTERRWCGEEWKGEGEGQR